MEHGKWKGKIFGECNGEFRFPAFRSEAVRRLPWDRRESLLSHGFAVPALPKGKPRALRSVPAPRIYEGGGPRSGRGSPPRRRGRPSQSRFACQLPQRGSRGRFAPFLPPAFMRGEGHAVAGGVPPPRRRGLPPQSRLRRASSPRGEAEGASHRSCPPGGEAEGALPSRSSAP